MPKIEKRSFDSADEVRPAGSGEGRIIRIGGVTFVRAALPSGWRWSKDVKPIARTDSCQANHIGYVVSGRLHVVLDDGSEEEFGPGDLSVIPPGHDAWVVGNEPVLTLDVTGADVWARPAGS